MNQPDRNESRLTKLLLSTPVWWLAPTPAAFWLNKKRVPTPDDVPPLPPEAWSRDARHELLTTSEERRRNIEGKGPGLATVSAVIVAAALLAVTGGWDESTSLARVLLVLAGIYAVLSLLVPLYLVGPLRRHTVTVQNLGEAADAEDPQEALAIRAAAAAAENDVDNLRLTNLLDAARRELSYTLALVLVWVLLVPATGLLRRDSDHAHRSKATTTASAKASDSKTRSTGAATTKTPPRP